MSREILSFDVRYKEPTGSFKAGDAVAGSVVLVLAQDIKFKGQAYIIYNKHYPIKKASY